MSKLSKYNSKFDIDIEQMSWSGKLQDMMILRPTIVKFHLDCAYAAYCKEHSLRYHPNPMLYIKGLTASHVKEFFDLWNKSKKSIEMFVEDCLNLWNIFPEYLKILYFTLFTYETNIVDESIGSGHCSIHTIDISSEDLKKLGYHQSIRLDVLMHKTSTHCIYSILRNGIMSMSNEREFCVHGSNYGAGIYLTSTEVNIAYGDILLLYLVINKERFLVDSRRGIYLTEAENLCLHTIAWDKRIW